MKLSSVKNCSDRREACDKTSTFSCRKVTIFEFGMVLDSTRSRQHVQKSRIKYASRSAGGRYKTMNETSQLMAPRRFKIIAVTTWLTLFVAIVALFCFVFLAPDVSLFATESSRDNHIEMIKAENDLRRLQQMAVFDVSTSYVTGANATTVCRIAGCTLLIVVVGSVTSLVQIGKLQKKSSFLSASEQ